MKLYEIEDYRDVMVNSRLLLEAIEKQYQALKGINFELNRGEFVGIMGASGSGKTTLLNILSTLDKPTSGNVVINGLKLKLDHFYSNHP